MWARVRLHDVLVSRGLGCAFPPFHVLPCPKDQPGVQLAEDKELSRHGGEPALCNDGQRPGSAPG